LLRFLLHYGASAVCGSFGWRPHCE